MLPTNTNTIQRTVRAWPAAALTSVKPAYSVATEPAANSSRQSALFVFLSRSPLETGRQNVKLR